MSSSSLLLTIAILLCLTGDNRFSPLLTAAIDLDERSLQELDFSPEEQARLDLLMKTGFLEIEPVVRASLSDTHTHLGWPVATQLPCGRIVMVFRQRDGHHGSDEGDRWVIHTDDLETWSPAEVLTDKDRRLGESSGMHAIGWTRIPRNNQPRVVILNGRTDDPGAPYRIYYSDNRGETWNEGRPFSGMLANAVHSGPNLISHPVFGLVGAFGQETGNPATTSRRNYLVRSHDQGYTWEERVWTNPAEARGVEPALAAWGPGHMVMIAREYSILGYGGDPDRKYFFMTSWRATLSEWSWTGRGWRDRGPTF